MNMPLCLCWLVAGSVLGATPAAANTLRVGPGQTYAGISDAMPNAHPGDVIEVQGGTTYPGMIWLRDSYGGTKDQPVTIRGIKVDGKRPVLSGVGSGQYENIILLLNSNHVVMESFEVIGDGGDSNYCVVHKADDVTLRDFVIHNCLHQGGLVGTDSDSGSLTLEYSELYHNGNGASSHQIYMTTDETTYPGSVFRIQFCYVHDGLGGNNVRSRAERNEIYYNWIEGAFYHELDLIGPIDGDSLPFREDSDIVGNVLIKKNSEWRIARLGGDGDGNTGGRYRFSNNTMVMTDSSSTVISLQNTVQALEMHNNVIYGSKAGFEVYDVNELIGSATVHFGSNNWVLTGTTSIPKDWIGSLSGTDPGFVDLANYDLRPQMSSPLVDHGTTATVSAGSLELPRALLMPVYNSPQHGLLAIGMADGRNNEGAPDIGAFEANASAPGAPPHTAPPEMTGNDGMGGCGCRSSGSQSGWLLWLAVGAGVLKRSRCRRSQALGAGGVVSCVAHGGLEQRSRGVVVELGQRRTTAGDQIFRAGVAGGCRRGDLRAGCAGTVADVEPPAHSRACVRVEVVDLDVTRVLAEVAVADRHNAVVIDGDGEIVVGPDQQALQPGFELVAAPLDPGGQPAAGRVDRMDAVEQVAGGELRSPGEHVIRQLLCMLHAGRRASPGHRATLPEAAARNKLGLVLPSRVPPGL